MQKRVLELSGVRLGYGPKVVLDEVDLVVTQGDFIGLVGPNGSGKSTLLKAVLGVLRPLAGSIHLGDPPPGRVRFGYVPQFREVDERYPLSALEVVLMGAYPRLGSLRRPDAAQLERAHRCLDVVGLADLAARRFSELSGGQKQRVLVARALATEAPVLLLDEPTNGLDLRSECALMDLLATLHARGEKTVVFVSHVLGLVLSYAPRVGILHEGRLRVFDTQDLVANGELSRLYGVPLQVVEANGRRAVLPERASDER